MTRILYVVTHPMTADILLRGQLAYLRERGFEVALASAPGAQLERVAEREGVQVHPLPLQREIHPLEDLRGYRATHALLREFRPTILNASTPKAALIALRAGRATGVPHRVFLLRGLRSETMDGFMKPVLRWTERACVRYSTEQISVSQSLATRARELGVVRPAEHMRVLGHGSSNGIDTERFRFDPGASARLRRELGLRDTETVVGFVGRLTRDKGIRELLAAFQRLRRASEGPPPHLVLLGRLEKGDPVGEETESLIRSTSGVYHRDWVEDTAPWYSLFDVVAFPSYREGLPNVPLEAACCERPVVAFAATGSVDVVVHGMTGESVPPGDVSGLAASLRRYLADPDRRSRHGAAARQFVVERFSRQDVWRLWADYYRALEGGTRRRHSGAGTDSAGPRIE